MSFVHKYYYNYYLIVYNIKSSFVFLEQIKKIYFPELYNTLNAVSLLFDINCRSMQIYF